ncbi:MAG TPA: cytochrome c oxidase subunit 3 [Blastocatellia bacterium]|nr:cytochrome c oxidase subunit 3 [Blastocatellia bacterium]
MGTTATTDLKVTNSGLGSSGPGPGGSDPFGSGRPKDWPPGITRDDRIEPKKYRIGMWAALASILMLFVALTSAYIVRQGTPATRPADWITIELPPVLWLNTALLIVSSLTIELSRRALKRSDYAAVKRWLSLTTLLGIGFLAGQIVAWRQLAAQGIYVSTNPHSSFFYLLTSLHGLHVLGGVLALTYVTVAALRLRIGLRRAVAVDVTAMYWHFMDGLWVYLFLLLFFWK